jgi:hypothetical protein
MLRLTLIAVAVCLLPLSAQEDVRKRRKGWADLGARLQTVKGSARIAEVFEGGAAAKADLREGDRIVSFDGEALDAERIMAALWAMEPGKRVLVTVDRDGGERTVELATDVIAGQAQPGVNNRVHHPPAIRAAACAPVAACEGSAKAVYAFDLLVSFEWDLTEVELAAARRLIEKAAAIFADAAEGQMYWRSVDLRTKKEAWDRAHYRIRKSGRGGGVGVEHVTPGGQCDMTFGGPLDGEVPAVIFAHEAGHMQLGSGDEYPYAAADPQKDCDCLMGRGCFNGMWDLCTRTTHTYREKGSCWENAKRWYPDLSVPEKPAKGPKLVVLPRIDVGGAAALEGRVQRAVDESLERRKAEVLKAVENGLKK